MSSYIIFIKDYILSKLRKLRLLILTFGKSSFLQYGGNLHIGANVRLWAPFRLVIGNNVYIGKDSHIECNAVIGDNVLIANRVSIIGRNDHDYTAIGYPVRFAPWVGGKKEVDINEIVDIGDDTWIGYSSIILSGVKIGKGSIIGAGSIVTKDIPEYVIAVGVPAKVIGSRFTPDEIIEHEAKIKNGIYEYSLMGLKYSKIFPG
jgi:acetyltransferase-like isoleucine patch superfamily enzyme